MTIHQILQQARKHHKNIDKELILRAFDFAQKAHQGQKRRSGEDYIIHPLHTAYTLAEMGLDDTTITAALLHDVVDDTEITQKEIEKEFGEGIAFLVGGITKLGKIKYRGVERQVENLRKLLLAMAEDIRVVLIKLADRYHNMQTLDALPPEKQKRIALETLEIYAPLAYRLGIGELKALLQDAAFPYVYPEEHHWLMKNVKDKYQERKIYLAKIQPVLRKELEKAGIDILEIHSRAKHYYTLYRKLERYDMDLSKIYDLVALRVLVKNIRSCYETLGIIHKMWKPLLGRIKDYIAIPKPNGYRSLHTTVFCLEGKITEIQIRTPKMHNQAEFGIASHWAYEEAGKPKNGVIANHKELAWVNQLREWQKEVKSGEEFLESLKIDFFKNRIFVFTPKGDVIDLPEGATPVDFAYEIHTELGDQCSGAKVDYKMVSLDYPLKNGEMVEILTQKNKKPSESWLRFVKTNRAKSKIKSTLRTIRTAEI